MNIFKKVKSPNGRRRIYFCGMKIFSYTPHKAKPNTLYAKRFDPNLTIEEKKQIIAEQFYHQLGYHIDFDNPKTFNEKIQWLKLYYHNPLLTICADKYLVRDYIKEQIGEEYLIPLLGVWDSADEIDFDALPKQFVLKVNWGSGQNIIVKNKSKLDIKDAKKKLNKWMEPLSNHYYHGFEWCYKDIKPKIICEQYIEQENNDITDYKVLCFHGTPQNIFTCTERATGLKVDFFTMDWVHLPFERLYHPCALKCPTKPQFLEKMGKLAHKLSKNFIFIRVDFYEIRGTLYIG